jgi:hypothetical protein
MRYNCPFCRKKHWLYSTMRHCYLRWAHLKALAS